MFKNGFDSYFHHTRDLQDTRKYLVYWIYTECSKQGKFTNTRKSDIEATLSAIELAAKFSSIHDAIVATQIGRAYFCIDKRNKTIIFEYFDNDKGMQFAYKFFEAVEREAQHLSKLIREPSRKDQMPRAIAQLTDSVKITKDKELRYSTNQFIRDSFKEYLETSLNLQRIIPDSWSIGAYTIGNYRSVWTQLCVLSLIHKLCFIDSQAKFGNYDSGCNSALFHINKISLLNYLIRNTTLDRAIVSEIIKDLIYNISIPHIDIIQQPLIEIVHNEIAFSPSMILGSLADRNLQVLLSKLPYRQSEYDRLKKS